MFDKESFLDHLEALRQTLLRTLAAFTILLVPTALLVHHYLPVLLRSISHLVPGYKLYYLTPMEPFFVELKMTLAAAFILGLPVYMIFWGQFLAPALYEHEKKLLTGFLAAAMGLFLAGAGLALFGVFPLLLKFSAGFATEEWQPLLTFNSMLSLAVMLMLGFGLIFQLPIVLLLMVRGGLIRTETLRKHRPAVLVGILILAAILTPPDVISQCMMAIPAYLFFEIALLIAAWMEKKKMTEDRREEDEVPDAPEMDEPPMTEEGSQTDDFRQEEPAPAEDAEPIPSVYSRHRRGLRQGRPRRYRRE